MWNHTKKKTTSYKEQNPEKVEAYLEEIKDILPEKIAYVDESGIDKCLYREYAYASRGEIVTEKNIRKEIPENKSYCCTVKWKNHCSYAV